MNAELEKIIHRGEARIKVKFSFNYTLISKIKQLDDARWSKTHASWHIPYSNEGYKKLLAIFNNDVIIKNAEQNLQQEEVLAPTPKPSPLVKPKAELPVKSPTTAANTIMNDQINVRIKVKSRLIYLTLPYNKDDSKFIIGIRYSRWDKSNRYWIIPNYENNLDQIKNYFSERIESIDVDTSTAVINNSKAISIEKNEVFILKTAGGRLFVHYLYNKKLTDYIKKLPFYLWDKNFKRWSIPYSESILVQLKHLIEKEDMVFKYEEEQGNERRKRLYAFRKQNTPAPCPKEYINKMNEVRYGHSTIANYSREFGYFISYYASTPLSEITEEHISNYLRHLVVDLEVSESLQNMAINAIKFYFEKVNHGKRRVFYIDRPRREKALPDVLNEDEIKRMISCIDNIKHKCIIMLGYSAGLRISEIINMEITDIDSERMLIKVRSSKGKKDRYTLLSKKFLEILREYYKQYRPQRYLFEGMSGDKYSTTSIQTIVSKAVTKANITKTVSTHTLRHSFATHMLERGVDIRYIQELLGHENSKTTEIYTHMTSKGYDQLKSPLDQLDL